MKSNLIADYATALREDAPWLADMLEALHHQHQAATQRRLPLTGSLIRSTILALLFEAGVTDVAWLTSEL